MVELRIDVDPETKAGIEAAAAELGVPLDRFLTTMMDVYFAEKEGAGGVWIKISDEVVDLFREALGNLEDEEETEG
ncbi:MAG: hypothetical protein ABID45_04245 [Patescibacteria group bacterium]